MAQDIRPNINSDIVLRTNDSPLHDNVNSSMYEQEKVHELSFSHPESEFIPSMCRLYRLLGLR